MFTKNNSQNTQQNRFQYSSPTHQTPIFGFGSPAATSNASAIAPVAKESGMTLADDVLEFCKCNYCNCYVSVGPVRMVDNKIACGRCKHEEDGTRLMIVEALARQFNFPCRFKNLGCSAVLKWLSVDLHEKVCDFKEIECTVVDCDWIGAKSALKLHFEQKHGSEIINAQKGITITFQEKKTSNFLYVSKNKTFLVMLSNDGEKINHQVRFFCTSLEACMYVYDICIYDSEKKLTFLNQKLQSFDDGANLFNTALSIDALQPMFANGTFVNISFQIKYTSSESTNLSTQHIECPVCFEPMVGNIIVGVCGHSVCEQCKKSLQNCPCCRSDFSIQIPRNNSTKPVLDIRNYSLETLIKKISLDL